MDEESDVAAIKETLNQYAVGFNTGDYDRWISLWADDGVHMPPGTPSRVGKEQLREGMKPAFDQMNLDITIHSIEEANVYGDLGLTRYSYTLNCPPQDGGRDDHYYA
jgi:ketosteroid isomerase-like protein